MKIEIIKSRSLLGGYNLLINGERKYHFVMKRDAKKKVIELSKTT